jgi:GNAT superfamily N-acetyltransferase
LATIIPATESHVPQILSFIRELAEYERLSYVVTATEDDLRRSLFGKRPYAEVILAYEHDAAAGFALFFHSFSTFLGQPGVYLEDLYVKPEFRGRGIGRALLERLAQIAVERSCGRLEWAVLDWNKPAIGFYKRLGAVPMDDWTTFRLTGEALHELANSPRAAPNQSMGKSQPQNAT